MESPAAAETVTEPLKAPTIEPPTMTGSATTVCGDERLRSLVLWRRED